MIHQVGKRLSNLIPIYVSGTATPYLANLATMKGDYVMTLDSDDEAGVEGEGPAIDPGFSFDVTGGALTGPADVWDSPDVVHSGTRPVSAHQRALFCADLSQVQEPISVDDIIERRRLRAQTGTKRKHHEADDDDEEGDSADESEGESSSSDGGERMIYPGAHGTFLTCLRFCLWRCR